MGKSSFKKISKNDFRGWMREEIFDLLPPTFFEDPVSSVKDLGGEVIKESKLRWAAIFPLTDGRRIFFKRDKTQGPLVSLKLLMLPSKGRKEWFIADQLKKRNLPVPEPLGWMEKVHRGFVKESYYLSEAIGSGVSLIKDSVILGSPFALPNLAKTLKKFHDAGLFHHDLHVGNFLWDGKSFYLTDLHRAEIVRSLSLDQRLWNFSQLFLSLRSRWTEKEQMQFIEKYFEGNSFDLKQKEEHIRKIHSLMERLQERQWRSRAKRCLKESTEFSIEKEKGARYYHRRDFPLDHLKRMIGEHLQFVQEKPSSLAKYSPEVMVSILKGGEKKVCVKQFRYPHFWNVFKEHFRRSRGLKAWLAGNGLRARGIPSLLPLAFVERKNWFGLTETFLVMETHEIDRELDRYILEGFKDVRKKRLFIKTFAQWLSHFHRMNLYHQDMKTCNILISEDGETWDFHLLDLEDVRLDEKVDGKKLSKNLLQLNTSTPRNITGVDRFRFFREYLRSNPIVKDERIFLKQLIKESRRRGLVYVSPHGVVVEPMS
jgi:tRNA A-37 threonylcarbamoyl transferase component Bud32